MEVMTDAVDARGVIILRLAANSGAGMVICCVVGLVRELPSLTGTVALITKAVTLVVGQWNNYSL